MAAVRDNLCDLGRMEIPRPKCNGMQFVATRGRQGFYRTIREHGSKYGIQLKAQPARRPQLSSDLFRPTTVQEETVDDVIEAERETNPRQQVVQNQHSNNNNSYHWNQNNAVKKTERAQVCAQFNESEVHFQEVLREKAGPPHIVNERRVERPRLQF